MRNKPPFSCPACGESQFGAALCFRCDELMVDTEGRPALLPPLRHHPLSDSTTLVGLLPPVGSLVAWLADRKRQRHAERRQRKAGALQPIGSASGQCRIRGRVHVLRPVELAPSLRAGAALVRRRRGDSVRIEISLGMRTSGDIVSRRYLEERAACGRFAVIDDSGVAIVDDDAFAIWSLSQRLPSTRDGTLAACDQDEVEIIGPAEPGPAPDLRDIPSDIVKEAGYRDGAPRALLFDGTADNRVLILAPQHMPPPGAPS